MTQESARQFLQDALEDRELRWAVQVYLLSRDVSNLVGLGFELDYDFTEAEIQQAIETYWDIHAPLDTLGEDLLVTRTVDSDAAITFFRYPANRAYVEGKRRGPVLERWGFTIWHGALTVALIGLCALFAAVQYRTTYEDNEALRRDTVRAEALVVEHQSLTYEPLFSSHQTIDYYVTYRFPYPELTQTYEQKVDKGTYDALKDHTRVQIRYNPSDPSEFVLESSLNDNYRNDVSGALTLGVCFVGGSLVALGIHAYNQNRFRHSTLVRGLLIPVAGDSRRARRGIFYIVFHSPHSQWRFTHRFEYPLGRYDLPELGSHGTVAILFADDWHWWLL